MFRLMEAEIYKLFKTRAFKVLCVVALLLAMLTVVMSKLFSSEDFVRSSMQGMSAEQQQQLINQLQAAGQNDQSPVSTTGNIGMQINTKDIFHPTAREIFYGSFGSKVIEILMAVLIGALVAGEYSSGTIKNILAYGKKREHYYISKIAAASLGMIILLAIMVSVATIISTFMFGWGTAFDINQLGNILMTFVSAAVVEMAVISFMVLLATLLKSNGSTIGLGIVVFAIIPSILVFLYGRFEWFDKLFEATPAYNWAVATSIRSSNGDLITSILISLATLVIVTLCGIMIFKKQDIK